MQYDRLLQLIQIENGCATLYENKLKSIIYGFAHDDNL